MLFPGVFFADHVSVGQSMESERTLYLQPTGGGGADPRKR
jgi:hypothetical protein